MKSRFFHLLLVLGSWLPLLAQGELHLPRQPNPALLPQDTDHRLLRLRSLKVRAKLDDRTATTVMETTYFNAGPRMEEAIFLFPLPSGATISSFRMDVNGRDTPAELLDAKEAAEIYRRIVASMNDPGLLQYCGQGMVRARIFPIEARSKKRISLTYQQVLERDGDLRSYRFPFSRSRFGEKAAPSLDLRVEIQSARNLRTVFCPTHQTDITRDGERRATLSLTKSRFRADRDLELFFSASSRPIGLEVATHRNRHGQFFMLHIQPDTPKTSHGSFNRDLTLMVDTSGSMAGEKLEQAQRALISSLSRLGSNDRFEIIRFSTVADSFAGSWQKANAANIKAAKAYVNDFEALGGTNFSQALELANSLPNSADRHQAIILLTDGKPTVGERDEARLIETFLNRKNDSRRLFPVGIGTEINTHLLDKLATATRGWRTYVRPEEDLELKISSLYSRIESPVLSQLRLRCQGVRLLDMQPRTLPDLFKGDHLVVFGRYSGHGPATITLEGRWGQKRQTFEYRHHFKREVKAHPFIPNLWAQRRVADLLDQVRLHGDEAELKQEIVTLARRYGLITPYTSYLILEDEASHRRQAPTVGRFRAETMEKPSPRMEENYRALEQKSGARSVQASEDLQTLARAEKVLPSKAKPTHNRDHQFTAGRAFYYQDNCWVDADLDGVAHTTISELSFASPEYFELIVKHPDLGEVLALGSCIRFVIEGQVYQVSP